MLYDANANANANTNTIDGWMDAKDAKDENDAKDAKDANSNANPSINPDTSANHQKYGTTPNFVMSYAVR